MRIARKALACVIHEEHGGEMLEYALVSGLVVIAALSVIGSIGTKVLARWTSLNNAM